MKYLLILILLFFTGCDTDRSYYIKEARDQIKFEIYCNNFAKYLKASKTEILNDGDACVVYLNNEESKDPYYDFILYRYNKRAVQLTLTLLKQKGLIDENIHLDDLIFDE